MDRNQKKEAVSDIKEILEGANSVVVVHYRGLTVDDVTKLRIKARQNGSNVKVTKNTLAKIAANDSRFAVLGNMLKGPTAIIYSKDEVNPAKTAVDFAKGNEKLQIIGGSVAGEVLDAKGVNALAAMPSLDQSRGILVGLLTAPAAQILRVLTAPGAQVARVINAHAQKDATA